MGALFAAAVRALLTGIVLVLEMANNYPLIFPMTITCLAATLLAPLLGGKPLDSSLLGWLNSKKKKMSGWQHSVPPCRKGK